MNSQALVVDLNRSAGDASSAWIEDHSGDATDAACSLSADDTNDCRGNDNNERYFSHRDGGNAEVEDSREG